MRLVSARRGRASAAIEITIRAMAQRFETRQWVPFPVELVFAFFANPQNLPHLMPQRLEMRIEDVRLEPPPPRPVAQDPARRFLSIAAGVGSEILISFRPLRFGPRASWLARVIEFKWNTHFVDEQARGPFASFRHRHAIEAEVREGVEGTLVTDEIEFALPYGVIGQIGGLLVHRQLAAQFAHRQQRLPEILAVAARQAARRA
jgi:ligand-binding SRPBCC domain-containing protein